MRRLLFSNEQKIEIYKGKRNNFYKYYYDNRFLAEQMRVIRLGLEAGINVEMYAESNIDLETMVFMYYELLKIENKTSIKTYSDFKKTPEYKNAKLINLYIWENDDFTYVEIDKDAMFLTGLEFIKYETVPGGTVNVLLKADNEMNPIIWKLINQRR